MEIPLVLSSPRPDRLVYAIPIWFRVVMGFILAVVIAALVMGDSRPGVLAWIALAILVLGGLYEDTWSFDGTQGRATHRAGLLIAAKSTIVAFSDIERICLVPVVKGTIPGTEDERAEKAAALLGRRADDAVSRRERHKKPFLNLEIECVDGTRYLIDHIPARRMEKLRSLASKLTELCEKPLSEE